jgi:hypothetical protein
MAGDNAVAADSPTFDVASEARFARLEVLIEGLSNSLNMTPPRPPGSPAGGGQTLPPADGGGNNTRERGAGAAAGERRRADHVAAYSATYADTLYKQRSLDSLGLGRVEQDPGYLGLVLRRRQDCEIRAAAPVPLEGPVVNRAWGVVSERPAGDSLWPPTTFEARDKLLVKNT